MKMIIIISLFALGLVLLTGIINKVSAKTETQKYETIFKEGNVEIRYYPEAILASVKMNGSYDDSRKSGFRILAGYIFGGNEEQQKIAMTSPVRMNSKESESTMSFVLPSKMEFNKLPKPVSNRIVLHKSKPAYAAALRYGGFTNGREIEKKKAKLISVLNNLGVKFKDNFEYLGYNPPWQMINRKNEVLVELEDFNPETFQQAALKEQAAYSE